MLRKLFGSGKEEGKYRKDQKLVPFVAYPFQGSKSTNFPPPLLIDASVLAEERPQKFLQESKIIAVELKSDDVKTQRDELSCNVATCDRGSTKSDLDKFNSVKLKEMIDTSIKEAVQTIVKQCSMDGEKLKESVEDPRATVCCNKDVPLLAPELKVSREKIVPCAAAAAATTTSKTFLESAEHRRHRCRSKFTKNHEDTRKCGSSRSKERDRERRERTLAERRILQRERNAKKSTKKMDNRRMTGNVNIYICSEANENLRTKVKEKEKPESCTVSSSEVTTECSRVTAARSASTSSKLLESIEKKRASKTERKLDCLCEEDNQPSTATSTSGGFDLKYEAPRKILQESEDLSQDASSGNSRNSFSNFSRDCEISCNSLQAKRFDSCCERSSNAYRKKNDAWLQRSVCVDETGENDREKAICSCSGKRDDRAGGRDFERPKLHSIGVGQKKNQFQQWSRCNCIPEEDTAKSGGKLTGCASGYPEKKLTVCKSRKSPEELERLHGGHTSDSGKKMDMEMDESVDKTVENHQENTTFQKKVSAVSDRNSTWVPEYSRNNSLPTEKLEEKNKLSPTLRRDAPATLRKVRSKERPIAADVAETKDIPLHQEEKREEIKSIETKEEIEEKGKLESYLGQYIRRTVDAVKSLISKSREKKVKKEEKVEEKKPSEKTTPVPVSPKKPDESQAAISRPKAILDIPIIRKPTIQSRKPVTIRFQETKLNVPQGQGASRSKLATALANRKADHVLEKRTPALTAMTDRTARKSKDGASLEQVVEEKDEGTREKGSGVEMGESGREFVSCKDIVVVDDDDVVEEIKAWEKNDCVSGKRTCSCCQLPKIACRCSRNLKSCLRSPLEKTESPEEAVCCVSCERPILLCDCTSPRGRPRKDCKPRTLEICMECLETKNNCKCKKIEICVVCNKIKEGCSCGSGREKERESCYPPEEECNCGNCGNCEKNCATACHSAMERCKCSRSNHLESHGARRTVRSCRRTCACGNPTKCACTLPRRRPCRRHPYKTCQCDCSEANNCNCKTAERRKICVVASCKPKKEIIDECCCENYKPCGSNELPYQRLSAFSDVMNELQQKISESVCCSRCRRIPCCCSRSTKVARCCVRRKVCRKSESPKRSRSASPRNCKCDGRDKDPKVAATPHRGACSCKLNPCRCRRGRATRRKPRAKCYYCKSFPCTCDIAREVTGMRSCKYRDSSRRAREEEEEEEEGEDEDREEDEQRKEQEDEVVRCDKLSMRLN